MLGPAPDDFWQRVVVELARTIWQRETSRVVGISAAVQHAVTTYTHDTRKPWHQQGDSRLNMPTDDAAS